jgi:hypothetical protein
MRLHTDIRASYRYSAAIRTCGPTATPLRRAGVQSPLIFRKPATWHFCYWMLYNQSTFSLDGLEIDLQIETQVLGGIGPYQVAASLQNLRQTSIANVS